MNPGDKFVHNFLGIKLNCWKLLISLKIYIVLFQEFCTVDALSVDGKF